MTRVASLFLAWLLAVAAHAATATWATDPAASTLAFAASFEGAPARGVFRAFDVTARLEDGVPNRIDVTVAITSADMGSDEINRAIGGPDWFDARQFPVASFVATDVQRASPGRYLAVGTLSLKGVTRPLQVPFGWTATDGQATMTGELVLDRRAFGIGLGQWRSPTQVAGDVKVQFEVRLHRSR